MEKNTNQPSNVQLDKFWTWRVNREENLLMKEILDTKTSDDKVIRLNESIEKAKQVAAKIKERSGKKK